MALVSARPASANIGVSESLTLPALVTVGQTAMAGGSFTVTNTNTAPNNNESNLVTGLRLVPSCGTSGALVQLCGAPDPGVFSISSIATGRAGTACAGTIFGVSSPDASGAVGFTSAGGPVLPPPNGIPGANSCAVDFAFSVLKVPTIDVDAAPGVQTWANFQVTSEGSITGGVVTARQSLMVTVLPAPLPTFAPLSPFRVWDSRVGPGPTGPVGPGGPRNVTVTGLGGVPATGVTAVVLNVTAVNPTAATFITAFPTGETQPLASNLNVPPNDVRPNLVIVKVGASGQVSFNNNAGNTNLIADVAGWYGAAGA